MAFNYIKYDEGKKENKNWIISETSFDLENQGKFEAIMALGNGYIGTRSALEEDLANKHPDCFVAGTFNTVAGPEVPELPNVANIWDFNLKIDGEVFRATSDKASHYYRSLNLKNGELVRKNSWNNSKVTIETKRFVSYEDLHLLGQIIEINCKQDTKIKFVSGIDGRVTNSGAQHFEDTYSCYHDRIISYVLTTTQSKINFVINKSIRVILNGKPLEIGSRLSSVYGYDRRSLLEHLNIDLKAKDTLVIELLSTIDTTRDVEYRDEPIEYKMLLKKTTIKMKKLIKLGYSNLFDQSAKKWSTFWKNHEILINTNKDWDIISTRFAQYHAQRFTPAHDNRCNIEAKGFCGEEYKGHTFWDTEIFILPYFIFTQPEVAKSLLEHRYFVKNSASIKALDQGYEGFMWPWETCWSNDGETCPVWGAVDRKEGERIKVWPAYNQLHIGTCITWAIMQYYAVTNDQAYMDSKGYEIIIRTAVFWLSRLEYNKTKDFYEITKVTGPNEYKENIDNNVFTNYMVHYLLAKCQQIIIDKKTNNKAMYQALSKFADLDVVLKDIKTKLDKMYLPKGNKDGIIPENDSFLSLKTLDMDKYKTNPDQLWQDYTFPELNAYQVLKQGDIVALFYTLGFLFDKKTIQENWKFYEYRCFHHSSLSLSIHATTANYGDDKALAYNFFLKASKIDLGEDMSSSDNGIHAAAIGGILKIVTEGFGGISNQDNNFIIEPNLPNEWNDLKFNFHYQQQLFELNINHKKVTITNLSKNPVSVNITYRDKPIVIKDKITLDY